MNGLRRGSASFFAPRWLWRAGALAAVLVAGYSAYAWADGYFLNRQLVTESPDRVLLDSRLATYAVGMGKAAFGANCVSCHGADLKGNSRKGIPNLTDNIWLYDFGRVSDIERTVLYGIRAGVGKSHNVTDMPAIGRQNALNPAEIRDVIAYLRSLRKQSADTAAVKRGTNIFQDKGVCYDCHSRDASGIPDYGAPSLIDDDTLFGNDDATLYKSIYDGRHGKCPAWINKLSFATIRAIAVFVHSVSKEAENSPNNQPPDAAPQG
jgi:cytochrome c oxidase cbb3-type subunit 3